MDKCPNCGFLLVPEVRRTLAGVFSAEAEADLKYLRETYPNVSTREELVAATEADYDAKHPRFYRNVTKEEAVRLSLDAWGKYLP